MSDLPTPHDREEVILNAMATGETIECPEPHTRKEIYLKEIYENGGGGGGGGEGVTPSQVVSIIASKTDSELDATSTNAVQNQAVYAALDDKVDVEDGKGLIASGDVAQISVNAAAIQTLNAGATQEGSVDKKIADALKVYMQKEPGKGLIAESDVEQIGTNKSAIETLNGSTATAGSVDKKISDALTNYVAKEDGKGLVSSTDVAQIGTNKTAIETLNGNASTDGSVDKKIATALGNYVEKETGKGLVSSTDVAQIGTNKSAIETLNGDASTTGSVDKKIADNLKGYVVKVGGKSLVLDEDITQITTNKNDIATLNSDETTEGSVAKKIADALVDVNDEVSDLKDAIDIIEKIGNESVSLNIAHCSKKCYAPLKIGDVITFSKRSASDSIVDALHIYQYDDNGNEVDYWRVSDSNLPRTVTIAKASTYLKWFTDTSSTPIMVAHSSTALPYEPYQEALTEYPKAIRDVKTSLKTLDYYEPTLTSGSLRSSDGSIETSSLTKVTEYIPIVGGIQINFSYDYTQLKASGVRCVCFYDSSKVFISSFDYSPSDRGFSVQSSSNASYIRISVDADSSLKNYKINADIAKEVCDLKAEIGNEWNSSTTYAVGTYVAYNGAIYKCLVQHSGQTPPNTTYWEQTTINGAITDLNAYTRNAQYESTVSGGTLAGASSASIPIAISIYPILVLINVVGANCEAGFLLFGCCNGSGSNLSLVSKSFFWNGSSISVSTEGKTIILSNNSSITCTYNVKVIRFGF